jgi:hypothetical protein
VAGHVGLELANVILKNTIGNPGRTRWASSAFCDQRLFTGKLREQGTQSAITIHDTVLARVDRVIE